MQGRIPSQAGREPARQGAISRLRMPSRIRNSRRYRRLKRRLFRPLTYIEQEAEDDIRLLENISDAESEVWPPQMEDKRELTTEELLQVDKDEVFGRLQKRVAILIYASGRRLERLTRWLIVLTLVLAILTIVSVLVIIHIL